ncbi:MAG: TetR family transcriptional regulator [Glaciihabitans sp.]|nr:TetR family transcriptional regulator [Glaciihabitans sp.]
MAFVARARTITERRQNIIHAADELFNDHGINSTTIEQIAAKAGVSLQELLEPFPEKRELIEVVLELRHRVWTGNVISATESVDDPRDKLLAIFDYLESWFAEESFQGCVFVNAYAEVGRDNPWMAAMAVRHKTNFGGIVGRIAEDAGMPASAANGIALLAEGAQVTAALTRTVAPAREARSTAALLIALYQGAPVTSSF